MLPTRSRLQTWNPDSLEPAGLAIGICGQQIYDTVRRLDDDCDRMPEARTWSGKAHVAATQMFSRATSNASDYLNYARSVGSALMSGGSAIGQARSAALSEAELIDKGELQVNDQWVVLIQPAAMSAEHAKDLQQKAHSAQAELNPLVHAVDQADRDTTEQLLRTMATDGANFHVTPIGPPGPPVPMPRDEVPDPNTDAGRKLQDMVRDQDSSTIVRETTESTDQNGNHFKTVYMVDGSKQVIKTEGGWPASAHVLPEGTLEITQYDKNGNETSITQSIMDHNGTETTHVWWTDGTSVVMTRTPDGKCSGGVTTPDGRHGILPDTFFSDPIPTTAGGALTGLEKQTKLGIPGLSAEALERIGTGAKFGGPAVGVATALYHVVTATDAHEACVAAWSGGIGAVGGVTFDLALSVLQPELAPVWAAAASTTGGFGFGYLGGIVGNLVCPP